MAQRTRVLAEMAQNLMHLAEDRDLAVSPGCVVDVELSCCSSHTSKWISPSFALGFLQHECVKSSCMFPIQLHVSNLSVRNWSYSVTHQLRLSVHQLQPDSAADCICQFIAETLVLLQAIIVLYFSVHPASLHMFCRVAAGGIDESGHHQGAWQQPRKQTGASTRYVVHHLLPPVTCFEISTRHVLWCCRGQLGTCSDKPGCTLLARTD